MATVSYKPTVWTEEVAITAERLNNIEGGIEDLVTQGNAQETDITAVETIADKHEALLYESGTNHQVLTQTSSGVPEWINPEVVSLNASDIDFDNTSSSLTATNVQEAVEQVATATSQNAGSITQINTNLSTVTSTTVNYSSAFTAYVSGSIPHIYKYGKVVYVAGTAKPASTITGSQANTTMFTLPSGYRPAFESIFTMQGSARHVWTLTVSTSGVVSFARLRNAWDAYLDAATTEWLPFSFSFITLQ